MPRNSSGVYTLPTGNPVVPGTVIDSDWANDTMNDLGNEMTNSLDRQGRGAMLAALRIVDGTDVAPGLAFQSETNSGLRREAAGLWWLVNQGQRIARVSAAQMAATGRWAVFNAAGTAVIGSLARDVDGRLWLVGSSDGVAVDLPLRMAATGIEVDAGTLFDITSGKSRVSSAAGNAIAELFSGALTADSRNYQLVPLADGVVSLRGTDDDGTNERLAELDAAGLRVNGKAVNTYDIGGFWFGEAPAAGFTLYRTKLAREVRIPANGVGSNGSSMSGPSGGDYAITIAHNGGTIGVLTWAAGNNDATLSGFSASEQVIPADNWIMFTATGTATTLPISLSATLKADI